MKRLLAILGALFLVAIVAVVALWSQGVLALPIGASHRELEAQLRDRSTVAVVGGVPLGLRRGETPLVDVGRYPALARALAGRDGAAVAQAFRDARLDGLMVRVDHAQGEPGSIARRMSAMSAVDSMGATYLDETAAVYEPTERIELSAEDGRRLIDVARLVLQGAPAPPERVFPEAIRRAYPTEVAVIIRNGRDPIIWRAVRGGSIARALIDATYAVTTRWETRQEQQFGSLHDTVATHPLTIAIFHDRGTLGARAHDWITRALDPRVYSAGFEQLGRWEYVLPPTPWAPLPPPLKSLNDLAHEHDLPNGWERTEITLYRFRAFELIENTPGGPVEVFDPR